MKKNYIKSYPLSGLRVFTALIALWNVTFTNSPADACGGFFCNATQPINQAAERILFAPQGDQVEMHVQIQYEGPPTGFGWILPVAPGVETEISSEALFIALDRFYGPQFNLNYEYGEGCDFPVVEFGDDRAFDQGLPAPNSEPSVQVISREPVGPYDRAILQADAVSALRAWLDENEFQIPEEIDAKLQPYIDAGAVFVVIKLLADRDVGDLVPLKLTFPGTEPTIPIIPTGVAAEPDMGVIVHMLGDHRAIPSNYRHVIINEAVIDWESFGSNYPDVVSQAADEAGGRAFVTDYAGEVGEGIVDIMSPYPEELIAQIAMASTFGEIQSLIPDPTNPDYQRIYTSVFGDVEQDWDLPADGLMFSERLRDEFNTVYAHLSELFTQSATITRLYTTMSAEEMEQDPSFAFNPDLDPVTNFHVATLHISCDSDGLERERRLELADGRSFDLEGTEPIARQNGELIRGADTPAAARIEQLSVAGQPEVLMDPEPEEITPNPETMQTGGGSGMSASTSASGGDDGGCEQRTSLHLTSLLFLLGLIIALSRSALSRGAQKG